MRPALCRLSYRAATSPPDHRELAHKRTLAPRDVALAFRLGDDRENLRHKFTIISDEYIRRYGSTKNE
ncbi:MAG TPA: hypothetical protein VGL29_07320 [Blastocatellia bacterium]